ncbi:MAG: penicillin-binding protein activator [Pseudomonadota bacterium]
MRDTIANRPRGGTPRLPASCLVALTLLIAGCSVPELESPTTRQPVEPTPTEASPDAITAIAEQLRADGDLAAAAAAYTQLAERATDIAEQQHFQLTAAELRVDEQAYDDARAVLANVLEPLASEDLAHRRAVLDARLLLVAGDADAALRALPAEERVLAPDALLRFHGVRADAAKAANQPGNALASLINLDILEGGANRDARNLEIWDLLAELDTLTLTGLLNAYTEDLPRGWLQLALDIDAVRERGADLNSTVAAWKTRYPGHPADALLVAYDDTETPLFAGAPSTSIRIGQVNRVALLLPFTERLQSFSGAIRDGAITALLESDTPVSLAVYDVGDAASGSLGAYQRAVVDGADLVVGPLRRNAALALATSANLQVPVLSLNYLNDGNAVDNLIQFGLSPEDEARNAADFIIGNGLYNAAIIHPATDAGTRSASAFSDRLAAWGGQVLATTELPSDATDFRRELSTLLLTDQSLARRRSLEAALGTKLTFETTPRQDIEALFIPVSPALGRLLKPQLDFHGAERIPTVSTSLVYAGRPRAETDRDLNQVFFNDIPWLLNGEAGEQVARQTAKALGVDDGPLARFFALGHDAMTLALNLPALSTGSVSALGGETGTLTLVDGRVRRQMPFAQFNRGLPRRVEFTYPGEPVPAVPEDSFGAGDLFDSQPIDPRTETAPALD